MLHPPVAGSCFGATAVPCVLPPAERGLGTPPWGLCMVCGHSEQTWGIWALTSKCCTPLGWLWALPGAFMDLTELYLPCGWSHSDSPPAVSPGSGPPAIPKPAPHPGGSSLRTQGLCEHTHVCKRRDLSTLSGYLQTRRNRTGTYCISSFAHRFLLQRLQAWALHLTPQEKSSLLGELCNKIKRGSNPQPSPAQRDRWVLLWGRSFGYLGENGDVMCTFVGLSGSGLTCQISTDHGEARGGSAELRGERGLWRQPGMSSFASLGLGNGCRSVTMPGPNIRAVGTGRGPRTNLASTEVWGSPQPTSPLPHTLHSSFSMSCWSLLICAIHWLLSSTQMPAGGRAERCHRKSLLLSLQKLA